MSENKGTYTEKRAESIKKHMAKLDTFKVYMPKGQKERYKIAAENAGESLNAFAIRAMDYLIEVEKLNSKN